jgi:two-component system, cell cycle response regulator DivK
VTRILYVEDNDDNVYMLKLQFELLDSFEILVAENGETGCAMALSEQPDIIIMDLDMPVVDGWEAPAEVQPCDQSYSDHCAVGTCNVGLTRKGACSGLR